MGSLLYMIEIISLFIKHLQKLRKGFKALYLKVLVLISGKRKEIDNIFIFVIDNIRCIISVFNSVHIVLKAFPKPFNAAFVKLFRSVGGIKAGIVAYL